MGIEIHELFQGVFEILMEDRRILATVNLTPGIDVYGEQLIRVGDVEYRAWSPFRSKLAAAILRGLKNMPISKGMKVLYLGVASGTTCSHISDIVGDEGHIWGVDFAPRPLRDLIEKLAPYRRNISPILGDARAPEAYPPLVPIVDLIYADVAQPDQSRILSRNAELYLKPD
ncbi:MAG: fibrillarin-like rRNA/tRNA 2'-O-methyltransferase, partial [Candidatus Bathyarchaeia archaeon]